MNAEIKEKWLTMLESGEYKRETGVLKMVDGDGTTTHCCLGVLCELYIQETGKGGWNKALTHRGESVFAVERGENVDIISRTYSSRTALVTDVKEWAEISSIEGEFFYNDGELPNRKNLLTSVNDKSTKEDFSDVIPFIKKYF